jgi:hypothetical protein
MRISNLATAAGVAAMALAGLTATTSASGAEADKVSQPRQCFFARNVNGFSAVDDKTVNVRVGVRDVYRLELLGPCPDIDWTWELGLKSRSSTICTGLDADLIVPRNAVGPRTCPVRTVRKLTPEEVAALPAKYRP